MTAEAIPRPNDESFVMRHTEADEAPEKLHMAGATTDPVKDYLKSIGKTPLLEAEQEVELSKRIEAGLMATHLMELRQKQAEKIELDAEEKALLSRWRGKVALDQLAWLAEDGQQAKNHMIEANLRLVVSLAKRYTGRGMLFLDLIQEGNIGLDRAVKKFDYQKGYKFSTYSTWWIRQNITRAMADQARTVRIPVHMVEIINKLGRVQRQMSQDLGREPTSEELAKELDMTVEKIVEVQKYGREPVSLDTPIGDGGGTGRGQSETYLIDLIADQQPAVDEDIMHTMAGRELMVILRSVLDPRELDIFLRRNSDEPVTLDDIGKDYGLTRERIRQIQAGAKTKLKKIPELRRLFDELD